MTNPFSVERRSFKRRAAKGLALCRLDRWGMGSQLAGVLIDISQGGVCISFPKELTVGMDIEIELQSLAKRTVWVTRANVRVVRPDDAGTFRISCQFEKRIPYPKLGDLA